MAGSAMITWTRRRRDVDPFRALEVQSSLARIERTMAEIEADDGRFAKAHHLRALRIAYDLLLDEACHLANIDELPDIGPLRRVVAEAELGSRGWTW
jgi:hypothetical protein